MKLVRFGERGKEQPGIIDQSGLLRDVSSLVDDWHGASLNAKFLSELAETNLESYPVIAEGRRLGAPVCRVGKIVGCALTYGKHAAEAGLEIPREPMFLLSAPSAINGPFDPVIMPRGAQCLDWEVELGVVFGKAGSYIEEEDAMDYVAGFCVANDVSERIFQLERGTQWTKGKSADTLKPLGPWLVTCDEVGDPNQLAISLQVNGKTMQSSHTSDMVFSIPQLISRVSEYLSWQPGDVMITGTPAGVGYGQDPPVYLKSGDVMQAKIEKLGAQHSKVQSYEESRMST